MLGERPGAEYDISIIGGSLVRGSRRIGLLAVSVGCVFAFMVSSAAATRDRFYTNNKGTQALPDASGSNGGEAGFGYPIEFVNSGNITITEPGFSTTCTEAELDTDLNHNTESEVDLTLVGGQFECESRWYLPTPSTVDMVFNKEQQTVTITGLKILSEIGEKTKCVFTTKPEGIEGTWKNAVGGEEEIGSTLTLSKVKLHGNGEGFCASLEISATFGAETFLQAESAGSPFDTEQVYYGP